MQLLNHNLQLLGELESMWNIKYELADILRGEGISKQKSHAWQLLVHLLSRMAQTGGMHSNVCDTPKRPLMDDLLIYSNVTTVLNQKCGKTFPPTSAGG